MVPGMVWRIDVDGVYRWTCGLVGVVGIAAVAEGTRPLLALQDFGRWLTGSGWHWTVALQTWLTGRETVLYGVILIIIMPCTFVIGTALNLRSVSTGLRAASTWLLASAIGLQISNGITQAALSITILGLCVWWRSRDAENDGWLEQLGYLGLVMIGALLAAGGPLLWALGARTSKQQVDAKVS